MRHKAWLTLVILLVLIVIVAVYGIFHANIGAVGGPGPLETSIATKARGWYVSRAAQKVPVSTVANNASSVSAGNGLYGMECASCHGSDGHTPAPIGLAMYPRVPSLSSPAVQKLSDKELFWVIKNGIRLSGMPGFEHINTDQEIWQLTYYVRSLRVQPKH
ncbi:MAG: cytochrome c [Acidobacteriaceae bacterium]